MNYLDVIFILITGFFYIRGLFKGLILEFASIAGLIGGFILANTYYKQIAVHIESFLDPKWSGIAAYALIFLGVLLGVAVVAGLLRKVIGAAGVAWLDYFLGGALGGAKGILLCSIILAFIMHFFPQTEILHTSRIAPHLSMITDLLRQFIPATL